MLAARPGTMVEHKPAPNQPTPEDRQTLVEIARMISSGETAPAAAQGEESGRAPPTPASPMQAALAGLMPGRLLDAVPGGVALVRDEVLLRANRGFALAFGYRSGEEVAAAGGLSTVLPGLAQALAQAARAAPPADPLRLALQARSLSGRAFPMPVALHDVSADGSLRLLVLHPAPETEPDVAWREPRQPAAPAPVLGDRRLDTDFLAKVSHEVRTPLNSIIGFAELIREETYGPLGHERYRAYLKDIQDSGAYALSLINDLLDLSKIEAGQFELNFAAVDVGEAIAEAVQVMQPQARRERVVLRAAPGQGVPPVLADRRSLKQILLNLLSNAVKFTEPGGQVIVSAVLEADGEVCIRVRDTGIGMTRDEIALALQPFRQLDTAPRRQVGTGLGLPLTKAFVEANRARLRIDSATGRGTRIDVVFPAERVVR